jgi:hypothetical protein
MTLSHLAAAHLIGADVFSSADRRLCVAANDCGFHVANPIDSAASVPESLAVGVNTTHGRRHEELWSPWRPGPGNKKHMRMYLTDTPDDELPRRSLNLGWTGTFG